jgi:glycosyltransferase involved in cell wall biosynthesis
VAAEHSELRAALSQPANVFDNYLHIDKLRLRAQLIYTNRRLEVATSQEISPSSTGSAALLALTLAKLRAAFFHRLRRSPLGLFLASMRRAAFRLIRALREGLSGGADVNSHFPDVSLKKPARLIGDGGTELVWHDRSSPSAGPVSIRLMGHVEGAYSLAIVNRGLVLALARTLEARVDLVPCHHAPYADPRDLPKEDDAALRRLIHAEGVSRPVDLSLSHHYPILPDQYPAAIKAAFFFWEETLVPSEMVETLERDFDAVFVASRFVRDALINSGCVRPIFLIPIGLSFSMQGASLRAGKDRFRFLHVSSGFPRKGVDILLRAYAEAFSGRTDVELYVKTFPNPHQNVRGDIDGLRAERGALPPIIVDEAHCDAAALRALYDSADCVVLPTRGEGFNLPAAEALAMGVPLILTGYGGHAPFARAGGAHLLPYRFAQSKSHLSAPGACWVEPDAASLARAMWRVLAPTELDRAFEQKRRDSLRRMVREQLTFDHGAQALLANLIYLQGPPRPAKPRLRLAFVSSGGARCGVAVHSRRLLEEVGRAGDFEIHFFLDDRGGGSPSQSSASVTWRIGDASIVQCLASIKESAFDVIWVHHQPALFDLDAAASALAAIAKAGASVILELHAAAEVVVGRRLSMKAVRALRSIDRIVVHQIADLNHLSAIGLSDNLWLVPLSVELIDATSSPAPEPRSGMSVGEGELLVGTFGFLFPHKGVDVVLRSIASVEAALGRRVRYLCLNALASDQARPLLESYKALADELGVADRVIWRNDFQPSQDALSALAACDIVLFPYGRGREGASAALLFAMRAGRSLVVSDEAIFEDARDIAFRMRGSGSDHLAEAIIEAVTDVEGRERRQIARADWAARRSFPKVGQSLAKAFQSLDLNKALDRDRLGAVAVKKRETCSLFVDVSELYCRDAKTGIQRVVRNILRELLDAPPAGFVVRPVYATPGAPWRHTLKFGSSADAGAPQEDALAIGERGDVFLGLDLSAHLFPFNERFIEDLRAAGVEFHFVVYDIIPLVFPQFSDAGLVNAFHSWIDGLWRLSDCLHCISESVAQDVRGFFAVHYPDQVSPFLTSFHLGADFEAETTSPPFASQAAILPPCAKFLMVGTVEPRKGHALTLDAFELLWASGIDVCLVIIGKAGWMVEPLVARFRSHKERGGRLFWFESVSDGELAHFYATCDCLIAASEAEGFGLPLIEAAHHGLPILARDIRVFREVAGDFASFFSGRDPEELFNAVCVWLERRAEGRVISSSDMTWLTWRESCARLIGGVLDA